MASGTRATLLDAFKRECAANLEEASSAISGPLDQLFMTVPFGGDLVSLCEAVSRGELRYIRQLCEAD